MIFWLSPFLLGFLGSFHCAVMCGPITLTLSQIDKSGRHILTKQLAHHAGRIVTYMFIGTLIGLAGKSLVLAGVQQSVSILAGILLLLVYFLPRWFNQTILLNTIIGKFTALLRKAIQPHFQTQALTGRLLTGVINGFLPCGLVYVGAVGALATESAFSGLIYMLLFGIGTLPMLLTIAVSAKNIGPQLNVKIKRIIPALIISMSIIFILRGMNLGVKYLSPKIVQPQSSTEMTTCPPAE